MASNYCFYLYSYGISWFYELSYKSNFHFFILFFFPSSFYYFFKILSLLTWYIFINYSDILFIYLFINHLTRIVDHLVRIEKHFLFNICMPSNAKYGNKFIFYGCSPWSSCRHQGVLRHFAVSLAGGVGWKILRL